MPSATTVSAAPCPRDSTGGPFVSSQPNMDVTDNPVVRALLREVLQTGQKVIAILKGSLLTVCCAATRAVLFLYDLTRVPRQWVGHWWAFAFDWVVGHAGNGRTGGRGPNFLTMGHDDRPREAENNMQAVEEGLHRAAEAENPSRAATASPSREQRQRQCGNLFETSTRGVVSRVTAAGNEVIERAPFFFLFFPFEHAEKINKRVQCVRKCKKLIFNYFNNKRTLHYRTYCQDILFHQTDSIQRRS